jgi:hypothetical protein
MLTSTRALSSVKSASDDKWFPRNRLHRLILKHQKTGQALHLTLPVLFSNLRRVYQTGACVGCAEVRSAPAKQNIMTEFRQGQGACWLFMVHLAAQKDHHVLIDRIADLGWPCSSIRQKKHPLQIVTDRNRPESSPPGRMKPASVGMNRHKVGKLSCHHLSYFNGLNLHRCARTI